MQNIFKNQSINKVNFFSIIFSAILFVLFIAFAVMSSYTQYKNDIKKLEKEYITSQKEFVKNETLRVLKFIKYKHKTNKTKPLKELQKEIVDVIENMRNKLDGTGYIFIYTFDGINIADPILKSNAGKNLIDFKDPNGKRVIYDLIQASKNPKGGYVSYVWNKPTTNTLEEKVSYAISYEPWRWMIGSGVYLKNLKDVVANKKKNYLKTISHYLAEVFLISIFIFLIGVVLYKYLMSKIQNDIQSINQNSKDLKIINIDTLHFQEFKNVAYHINIMNENLKDLNKNLENKVQIRTKELKKSQEYALKLVENQDKFIKDAIHEINTPLSIIISNIDLFKLKFENNKYLSKIEAGSKIIHNIYNDLEYMVKKDRIEYPYTKLNISKFIHNRIEFFSEVAYGNDLKFHSDIENNLFVEFNEILLQRICDNTISNAVKYSFLNSTIDISLHQLGDKISLKIANSGKTIENQNKLFERFYRENNSRGGFGIGLNIIKEICDNNNVTISVNSKDNYTTFEYLFNKV